MVKVRKIIGNFTIYFDFNNIIIFVAKTNDFKFGNYRNYYFKRLGVGCLQEDIRLELMKMHPECFRDKQILDIGCNSGILTINFVKHLRPCSVLAIDIDGNLIDMARKNLQKEKTDFSLAENQIMALNSVIFRKVFHLLALNTT